MRDSVTTEKLLIGLRQLISLTETGQLHWDRQIGSAHRYARWKDNLLILGPAEPPDSSDVPRYLFVTPFDSPECAEINSHDPDLGADLLKLVRAVEVATKDQAPKDPFAINNELF
jgi:hypothetical protein